MCVCVCVSVRVSEGEKACRMGIGDKKNMESG